MIDDELLIPILLARRVGLNRVLVLLLAAGDGKRSCRRRTEIGHNIGVGRFRYFGTRGTIDILSVSSVLNLRDDRHNKRIKLKAPGCAHLASAKLEIRAKL